MNVPAYTAPVGKVPGSPGATTDANAGHTQLEAVTAFLNNMGRAAAPGTTTVTLTAEAATDYGTAASGTFTVNGTGAVVSKSARFALSAGATAPAFTNAPTGQPYKFIGATYVTGRAYSYSLLVCVDRIEVVILPD